MSNRLICRLLPQWLHQLDRRAAMRTCRGGHCLDSRALMRARRGSHQLAQHRHLNLLVCLDRGKPPQTVIFRIHGEGVLLAYWGRNEEPEREEVDRVWREREETKKGHSVSTSMEKEGDKESREQWWYLGFHRVLLAGFCVGSVALWEAGLLRGIL